MKPNINLHSPAVSRWTGWIIKALGLWLVLAAVVYASTAKLDYLKYQASQMPDTFVSAAERTRQLDCLTRNIYWEAASEPFEGKVAVAQVTMNRVEAGRFGDGVCGVVYQKNIVYEKVVCQFSWFCEGNHKVKAVHGPQWKESEEVAKKVLLEGFRLPSLKNAYYYHADYVSPGWNKPRLEKIGRHIFYGERA